MALAIIPARLASSRFPEKVLASETGRPLVQHVVDRAKCARSIDRVVVAADDPSIAAALEPFGSEVVMTSPEHPNGTSRIREALAILAEGGDEAAAARDTIVVNVQGDEPEIDPGAIDALVETLDRCDPIAVPMATLAGPFAAEDDPADPNLVKVVLRTDGSALYFSRAMIPDSRRNGASDDTEHAQPQKHIGVYAYRAHFLDAYVDLPATPLERAERLEQLRVIEHGYPIAVARVATVHHGIDTHDQYRAFVARNRRVTRGGRVDETAAPSAPQPEP